MGGTTTVGSPGASPSYPPGGITLSTPSLSIATLPPPPSAAPAPARGTTTTLGTSSRIAAPPSATGAAEPPLQSAAAPGGGPPLLAPYQQPPPPPLPPGPVAVLRRPPQQQQPLSILGGVVGQGGVLDTHAGLGEGIGGPAATAGGGVPFSAMIQHQQLPQPGPIVTPTDLGGSLKTTSAGGSELRVSFNRCDLMWSPNNPVTHELFTPVKGCEVDPSVIIRDHVRNRYIDDDEDVREAGAVTHYRWSRGPAQAVCFFHPHRPAQIQCTITLRCYCCYHCCNRGYKQLRRFYASGGKCSLPRQANEFSYGVPSHKGRATDLEALREVDSHHYQLLTQAGLVVDRNSVRWTPISYERNYTPSKDDVGHQLRFEVIVLSVYTSPEGDEGSLGDRDHQPDEVVRVVASAEDRTTAPSQIGGQPRTSQQPQSQGAATQGPRSSPMSLSRHAGSTSITNPTVEAAFWMNWDKYLRQHSHDERALSTISEAYKIKETACVINQAPTVGPRPIIPVGILALFTETQESLRAPQRIIPPGSSLARALGIGVERGWQVRRKVARSGDAIHNRLADRFATEKSAAMASVAEWREALLTDGTWASWIKGESPPPRPALPVKASGSRVRGVTPALTKTGGDGSEALTVMTWNVLADIYATSEAYPLCEPYALAWRYRKDRLVAEIINNDPDIVCLQEVQADHFEEFFAPALLRRGYEGLYKQKVSQVFRGDGRRKGGKYVADGCATFFKVPKFRLMDHFGIEFSRVAPPPARGGDGKSDKRINKDNVALVLCLDQLIVGPGGSGTAASGGGSSAGQEGASAASPQMPKGETRKLVVANTHILANPEAPDVKIWQTNTLTSVLTEYMEKSISLAQMDHITSNKVPGLIVCGDFNSTPDSAVYQLVCAGQCDANHAELHSSDVYKWLRDVSLGHRLHLRSSYGAANFMRREAEHALTSTGTGQSADPSAAPGGTGGGGGGVSGLSGGTVGSGGAVVSGVPGGSSAAPSSSAPHQLADADLEPEFTNYTHQYVGCLDYIFYDDRCLKLTGTLELLTEVQLLEEANELQRSDWALPSPQRPSDHTPLMSRFEWIW